MPRLHSLISTIPLHTTVRGGKYTHAAARSVHLGPALGFGGALGKHASSRLSKKTCLSGIGHRMLRKVKVKTQDEERSDFAVRRLNLR